MRVNNCEYLSHLGSQLGNLPDTQQAELVKLLNSLFLDTPSCISVIEHDIDVGYAQPVRQRSYRLPIGKCKRMKKEVKYMLEQRMAEPACSSWASPCLLADKADGIDFAQILGRLMLSPHQTVIQCLIWSCFPILLCLLG